MESDFIAIEGYEDRCQINRYGLVKNAKTGKLLAVYKDRSGYLCVRLSLNGAKKHLKLHRLLAIHFIPNPDDLPIVRHLDDNKENNEISNLAWGTDKDNAADALKNGKNSWKNKTHCKHGHKYTPENTYYRISPKSGNYGRYCAECQRINARLYKQKKRNALSGL